MREKFDFDYIAIGSGIAGKIGALMASNAGLKTAVIEQRQWGGSFFQQDLQRELALAPAHAYAKALRNQIMGIQTGRFRYIETLKWRVNTGKKIENQTQRLLMENKVECIEGKASFLDAHTLGVGNDRQITVDRILIATGARLKISGIAGLEKCSCLTPEKAFWLKKLPKSITIIGAGTTGCEMAQYFANFGVKTTLVELSSRILPKEDEEVGKFTQEYLIKKMRMRVLNFARVIRVEQDAISKKVILLQNGKESTMRTDAIVLATGYEPNLALNLEKIGIKYDYGKITTTKWLQTNEKNIWAAGDVVGGISTPEKCEYEAALATANALNKTKNMVNYQGFTRLVNIFPQIAAVGMTEDDCIKAGINYKKTLTELSDIIATHIYNFPFGFIKLITDKQNKILGATIIAPNAEILIQEIAFALRHGLTTAELANTPHAALKLNEIIRLAARQIA